MAIYQRLGARAYDVSEVFTALPEATQEVLCTYADDNENIVTRSNTFTIIMNRDIRKTVEISSEMAVHLARKYPEQKILLVNTYAGTDLMQQTIAMGLARSGAKLPPEFARHLESGWENAIGEAGSTPEFPLNLRILDCESGMLEAWRIEEELKLFGCVDDMPAIVILNSFEFSAYDGRDRRLLAQDLVTLREKRSLTMVVFSHEMRADVKSHTPSHGGIGILSAFSGSVWRIMSQYDRARYNAFYRRIANLTKTSS